MLVRMKQTEIYLTLKSTGRIKLSAKVFEQLIWMRPAAMQRP